MAEDGRVTPIVTANGLSIALRAPFSRVALRGRAADPKFAQGVESVAGIAPPAVANTAVSGLLATLLWLGPDEWLLLSETQEGADLVARLHTALKAVPHAATDVSDARVVFTVAGPRAADVLAKGCTLDLHPRVFGQGRCAQTLLAKASIILHQRGPEPTFDLYVARSFAEYVQAWLVQAALEYS